MNFGEWVDKTRKSQNLDIRSLAEKSGVDVGTISRIENGHTKATIYTAFRLSEALNTSLQELLLALNEGATLLFEGWTFIEDTQVLNLQDIERLIEDYEQNSDKVTDYLINNLNNINSIVSYQRTNIPDKKFNIFMYDDLDKLLFRSPLYRFDLKYPGVMHPDIIRFIFERKGAMISNDIQAYMRYRQAEGPKKLTRVSSNALVRLAGAGSIERVGFDELLTLDKELGEEGRLIGMFWEICRFDAKFNPPSQRPIYYERETLFGKEDVEEFVPVGSKKSWERKLATIYVLIYRWYLYLSRGREAQSFTKY